MIKLPLELLLKITQSYNSPNRTYHNFKHISFMFDFAKSFKYILTPEQEFAILMHDYIYEPGYKNNEVESALIAKNFISEYHLDIDDTIVSLCILSTILEIPLCEEAEIVVDLDLLILSMLPSIYDEYLWNVKQEYSNYSEGEWKKGRADFLLKMISRKQLFYTLKDVEENAKNNMRKEYNSYHPNTFD